MDNYLGRLPKARILEAVREARGDHSAQHIGHPRAEMAEEAERLLDGTGWLPEPLRLAGSEPSVTEQASEAGALPDFLTGEDAAAADPGEDGPRTIAAEWSATAGRLRPLRANVGRPDASAGFLEADMAT